MVAEGYRASVVSLVGRTLDERYRIVSILGEGTMGAVYQAEQPDGPPVAIKVLHEELGDQPELRERFEREARALFGFDHPNILTVYDYGIVDGQPYLVMELLRGMTLDELVETELPPPEVAIRIVEDILEGLQHAHEQGAAHRDLKTENIWVQPKEDGTYGVKILDFGLVKFTDTARWSDERKLTMQGMVFGSPGYMPPEQCIGSPADERSDVYSMGVVLYELLTGEWPFMEENQVMMLQAHISKLPPSIESGNPSLTIDPALEALYQRAMSKDPASRFPNAGAMLAALRAIDKPAMPRSSKKTIGGIEPKWLAAGAGGLALVALLLYLLAG